MRPRSIIALFIVFIGACLLPPFALHAREPAPVQLTPEGRQLIGVTFAAVERRQVFKEIQAAANVEPDEQLQFSVQTRFSGWIRRVFANQTFAYVRKGQPLFTVYSPDLAASEDEYALALKARARLSASSVEGVAAGADDLAQAAAGRLALLGIDGAEIARLKRGGKPRDTVTVFSPASGYITERSALPNMYVQPETRLYTITSYSVVWVYAAVFQNEIGGLALGDRAVFSVDAYPGESFDGRVDYIWPVIDRDTRTVRVRVAFDNRGGKLKPGMYGKIALRVNLGVRTVVPAGAVLRTGTHDLAFVDRGGGYLLAVNVELGPRAGNDLVVLRGLSPGQRVAASANFLIDSESQLQGAGFTPPPPGVSANSTQPAAETGVSIKLQTNPSPPQRGSNAILATVTDARGKPIDGASVSVTFQMAAMPAMGMPAMREETMLSGRGAGLYQGGIRLPSGGTWQVSAVAAKQGRTLGTAHLSLTAAGAM